MGSDFYQSPSPQDLYNHNSYPNHTPFKMTSRHLTSSKSKSNHKGMDSSSEDALAQCKSAVNSLSEIRSYPSYLDAYLASARSAMNALDRIHFFREHHRLAEQIWLLNGLQDFAFHEGDNGFIKDVADWCQAGWLRVLRNHPDNVETLTGKLRLLTAAGVAVRQPLSHFSAQLLTV